VFPLILTQLLRLASPGLTRTATPKFPPKLISDISGMYRRCHLIIFWQGNGETQRILHRQRIQQLARSSAASLEPSQRSTQGLLKVANGKQQRQFFLLRTFGIFVPSNRNF
jgi:hypothetical protein